MRLGDICNIQMGYTARTGLEGAVEAGVLALQVGDMLLEGGLTAASLSRYTLPDLSDRYFVGAGDVVFRSRGARNTAIALGSDFGEQAVAISPVIVLRPDIAIALPEYLAWAINSQASQRKLEEFARGTSVRMVPKSALDDLDIDIPSLETQSRITKVARLADYERALLLQLAEKRSTLANQLLSEIASQSGLSARSPRITQ